jgi:hypothetical protein
MAIEDRKKKLFSSPSGRLRSSAGRKFSVEIKGDARGSVILQKQIAFALGRPEVLTDFMVISAVETIPIGSILGRLASPGQREVEYRVRIGNDFTGTPEFG